MNTIQRIRQLRPDDAPAMMALRHEALVAEPTVFGSSPTDDRMRSTEFVHRCLTDREEQALFGGFSDGNLVGMVGIVRETGLKERHKARIWGVYVNPSVRRNGIARGLLEAAIDFARGWPEVDQIHLAVAEPAAAARLLYLSLGFCVWGREPRALSWQGEFIDEEHLVLRLR